MSILYSRSGITTYRENSTSVYGLNEIYTQTTTDRLQYRGSPRLMGMGSHLIDISHRSSPTLAFAGNFTRGKRANYTSTEHALFLMDDLNQLYAYGSNSGGWLGLQGIAGNRHNNFWSSVEPSGHYYCCGIQTTGTLWTWGYNTFGQLGHNDATQRNSPVQILGTVWKSVKPFNWTGLTQQYSPNTFAITQDNTLYAWGSNYFGMLGQNETVALNRSTPIQIPGTWIQIERSGQHAAAIKPEEGTLNVSRGQLYTWGHNNHGQLGLNDVIPRSSPTSIMGNVKYILPPNDNLNTFVKKQDGSLWGWGLNDSGQLGQNDVVPRSSPVKIPGSWQDITIKNKCVLCFQQGTGQIWGWGRNDHGQLGQYTSANFSNPVQIPGEYDPMFGFSFDGQVAHAVKRIRSEGEFYGLWGWGDNRFGQLGIGIFNSTRYSPSLVSAGSTFPPVGTVGAASTLAFWADLRLTPNISIENTQQNVYLINRL